MRIAHIELSLLVYTSKSKTTKILIGWRLWTLEKEKEEEKETSDGHGNRFKLMLISHGAQKEMLLH